MATALVVGAPTLAIASDGSLDDTFDSDGRVTTDFGGFDRAQDAVLQPDGKIVVVGAAGFDGFGLARYQPDGSLDAGFGSGGLVRGPFADPVTGMTANGVALQADGKIVAAGRFFGDFALARYHPDGSIDPTFGRDGTVVTDFGDPFLSDEANAVAVQTDGKIIAAGSAAGGIGIARYNSDGSLDTSFGSSGIVMVDLGIEVPFASAIVIQPDGKIVIAGGSDPVTITRSDLLVMRFLEDGSLDKEFGIDGIVRGAPDVRGRFNDVALQPDGRIVAAGGRTVPPDSDGVAVVRYNTDGSVDTTFSNDGLATGPFGSAATLNAVAIQPFVAGFKIVVAGRTNSFGLARYDEDGSLDTTFGTGGSTITDGTFETANAVLVQDDGQIVVAGNASGDFGVVRYNTAIVTEPTVGLVDPAQGLWHLPTDAANVIPFYYGNPGDIPMAGDWDCDGISTPGLFRPTDGFVYLRNSNTQGISDLRFFVGNPADAPLAGDFDGDGCDTVSLYRRQTQEFFIFNELGENGGGLGAAEFSFEFGNPGDQPVVGDWDGDDSDEVGLHRESSGLFYWRNTLNTGVADGSIIYGDPGDRFVAWDWGVVDGADTPGVFRPSDQTFYFRHTLTTGVADSQFRWNGAEADWLPVAGDFGLD